MFYTDSPTYVVAVSLLIFNYSSINNSLTSSIIINKERILQTTIIVWFLEYTRRTVEARKLNDGSLKFLVILQSTKNGQG
jgi:hypothetical protein